MKIKFEREEVENMFKFTDLNKEVEPFIDSFNKRIEEFTKKIESILLSRFGSDFKELIF